MGLFLCLPLLDPLGPLIQAGNDIRIFPRFGQAVHMGLAQDPEALRPALQGPKAKVHGPQLQIQEQAFERF